MLVRDGFPDLKISLSEGMKIDNGERKRALLLHYAGETVYDIYEAEKKNSEPTYEATKGILKKYFEPKKNTQMEIYKFRTYKQNEGQSLDEFVTELRKLAKTCEFQNVDKEILSQVIQNCRSNRLRRRALREPDKSLDDILTLGRTLEIADSQATEMERESVNKVKAKTEHRMSTRSETGYKKKWSTSERQQKTQNHPVMCRNCGGEFPHKQKPCPAKGKKCNSCHKLNHFAKVCRSQRFRKSNPERRVYEVQDFEEHKHCTDEPSSDEEYTYSIQEQVRSVRKTPMTSLKINKRHCKLMIDTGATVNVLDETTYKYLGCPKLKRDKTKLVPYGGGSQLEVLGNCELEVETRNKFEIFQFHVVKGSHSALLGYTTAPQLELVHVVSQTTQPKLEVRYPEVFKNKIGRYNGKPVKLHINLDVKPVAQRSRRTPFHLRPKVEKEIQALLEQDIIEKVGNTPTPWVSPIVTPPKKDPNEIRLCIDMREANKAIVRERQCHSKRKTCYQQLKNLSMNLMAQQSSANLTLNLDTTSWNLKNSEHDSALEATLQALQKSGLTVNSNKCELNKDKITFFGIVFSKDGISPDPRKVKAVKESIPPTNVAELRSFLGMTNYSSRFIPHYATITEPLRSLTRQSSDWKWDCKQQNAFDKLKEELSSETVMTYSNPSSEINVHVDASPIGLGAIMTQKQKSIAYASRAARP
ncbi:uncharacterized protein K02A2.6-like [Saccostrea cucullata]|uniref:uncharacterized protein K02A2.6-like n=1 Tax=Saccostrea cuccullata TaxID=36930 RepID=UPI002ED609C0